MPHKVLVSGCFDGLHSGHVTFLQNASSYGELLVAVGSDATIFELKGRSPIFSGSERLFMVQALACVSHAFIAAGSGELDFADELCSLRPDRFIVNDDGHSDAKEQLCRRLGIEYFVLRRVALEGLPIRSSTALREKNRLPYRLDLAGGWLDQPFVSSLCAGPVLTISLEPTLEFNDRSGMATSTRKTAWDLWGGHLPAGSPEKTAKTLFACENPPGTVDVSGSQDAIGLVFPGVSRAFYDGAYWPRCIDTILSESILTFLERHVALMPLRPRSELYHPLKESRVSFGGACWLSESAEACWQAILQGDLIEFGRSCRASFEAQISMFPSMATHEVMEAIDQIRADALGWKLSGAGGGGYLVVVSRYPPEGSIPILIRRANF